MVHCSDNETARYRGPDYLQVKEMVFAIYLLTIFFFSFLFFGSGWKLLQCQWRRFARLLHVVLQYATVLVGTELEGKQKEDT